jgi:hypothetical protein
MREIEKLGREIVCIISCLKYEDDKENAKALLKALQEYNKRIVEYYKSRGVVV